MKKLLWMSVVLGGLALGTVPAWATLEVGVGVSIHATTEFYEPLAAHGGWVEVHSYGRCWRPTGVAVGWRPYCDGHWEWTDCGWFWVSDEPWAWACYHYGRWVFEPAYGWIWAPGIEWAPAWVYWRVSNRHVGWAPCPPRGRAVVDAQFVFVDSHRFHDRVRPSTVIINNTTIIHETKLITKTRRETRDFEGVGRQKVVINEGPGLDRIQKVSGQKFERVSVREVARQARMPERRIDKVVTPDFKSVNPRPEPNAPRLPDQNGNSQREWETERVAPRPEPAPDQRRPERQPEDRSETPSRDKSDIDRHDDGRNHERHDHGSGHGRDKEGH